MITFDKTHIHGWEAAIRGMRNPWNSWEKSDTHFLYDGRYVNGLGENDFILMRKLAEKGPVHGKFMRMIIVTVDITAPLYWWKEFDTYKIGTVSNSCSTMHRIAEKVFTMDDFSTEHLLGRKADGHFVLQTEDGILEATPMRLMETTIGTLNDFRKKYLETREKKYWWQLIQLLPSSYNQRRTIQLNYAVLQHIYPDRTGHRLDEWLDFCKWIRSLPNSELITGEA